MNKALHAKLGTGTLRVTRKTPQVIFQRNAHSPAPNRAKRLKAAVGSLRNDDVRIRLGEIARFRNQLSNQRIIPQGSVAGKDQSPFLTRFAQGAQDAAEGSHVSKRIGKNTKTAELRTIRAQQGDVHAVRLEQPGEVFEKSQVVPRQQCFIPPHPGAFATHQNVTKGHANRMVALQLQQMCLGISPDAGKVRTNKFLRICLLLIFMAVLSQSSLPASERLAPGVTGELRSAVHGPAPSQPKTSRSPAVTRRVSTVLVDEETGRLVRVRGGGSPRRSTGAEREAIRDARQAARKTPAVEPGEIRELIDRTARKHGVDPKLVHSVVRAESNYEQKAISPKGALGLMQLIPATAKRYGVDNPFDASQNIDGGVRYLKFLTERFQGNLQLALAAYNAGEGAVDRHGGIPPYRETRAYVTKVTRGLNADKAEGESVALLAAPSGPAVDSLEDAGFAGTGSMLESNVASSRTAAVRMYTDSEGRLHLETVQ